jgi:hypothetical protein
MSARHDLTLTPDEQALKADAKALVRAAGGVEVAADYTGRSKTQLSSYCNPHTADFMPIDAVVKLEAVTHGAAGHPIVTRANARRAGYALVKQPEAPACAAELTAMLGSICKEHGDVVQRVCALLQTGVTPEAVAALLPDIDEAMEVLAQLRAAALAA